MPQILRETLYIANIVSLLEVMKYWLIIYLLNSLQYFSPAGSNNTQCSIKHQVYYDPAIDQDGTCQLGCEAGRFESVMFIFIVVKAYF